MNIAICAPFLEADLLEEKIHSAVPNDPLFVDEYYSVETLLALPSLSIYESVWVALPGAVGMEAVLAVRERYGELPIVWISADEQFVWCGAKWCSVLLLTPESSPEQFRAAVETSRRRAQQAL